MARTVITEEKKIEINELYLKIGTYSGVAKIVGCAPSTVKKYIIEGYVPQANITQKIKFKKEDLPQFSSSSFRGVNNWGDLCRLSNTEREEIKELWKELVM